MILPNNFFTIVMEILGGLIALIVMTTTTNEIQLNKKNKPKKINQKRRT